MHLSAHSGTSYFQDIHRWGRAAWGNCFPPFFSPSCDKVFPICQSIFIFMSWVLSSFGKGAFKSLHRRSLARVAWLFLWWGNLQQLKQWQQKRLFCVQWLKKWLYTKLCIIWASTLGSIWGSPCWEADALEPVLAMWPCTGWVVFTASRSNLLGLSFLLK